MGVFRNFFVLCSTLLLLELTTAAGTDLEDTVVIEADDLKRQARQIFLNAIPIPELQPVFLQPIQPWSRTPCFTKENDAGVCMSFRQCYPTTGESNFEIWLLGVHNTCEYTTAQGRRLVGVCCTGEPASAVPPQEEIPIVSNDLNNRSLIHEKQFIHGGWPPPLPTHPPHHTIPPLPTHPPQHYPQWPPQTTQASLHWPPTTSRIPTLPTTKPVLAAKPTEEPTRPPWSQPTQPTRPPWSQTTQPPQPPAQPASCGAKNGPPDQERIVGGHNADKHEWPWMAALFNNGRQFCGGSLIDDSHILSAAHCVAHMSSWDVARLTVRLGDYNIREHHEVQHIEKRVKRVVRHRGFDSRTLYNDIAILTLDSPVQFTNEIRPICLPTSPDGTAGRAGQRATVIGWGSLRESGPQPAVLQEVNIPVWSNAECRAKYGRAAPGGIVDHMLCAGQADKDSCSGDSGGPLMVNSGRWVQAGIVSWGIGCGKGQYPGVYSRVESFLPWIQKNLKD